jgi:YD repeat-containing protein
VSESPVRFERHLGDGSVEIYMSPDGAPSGQRRIFLTEFADPTGARVQLTYDGSMRLVGITDAVGQVSTLSYELAADPLKVTKFTDPFGRTAI